MEINSSKSGNRNFTEPRPQLWGIEIDKTWLQFGIQLLKMGKTISLATCNSESLRSKFTGKNCLFYYFNWLFISSWVDSSKEKIWKLILMPKKGQKRLEFGDRNSEDTKTFWSTAFCF